MPNHKWIRLGVTALAVLFFAAFENRARAAFANGDFVTYSQQAWGTPGTEASSVLLVNYNAVYPSTQMEVGIPRLAQPPGFSILLTGSSFVVNLLPTTGAIGPLLMNETNPGATVSGTFGGDVLALQLDVDFSDAGFTAANAGIPFGDLVLTGFDTRPLLNGLTVRQFLANANTLLGGGSGIYTIGHIAGTTDSLTNAFAGGTVSQWAQDHLRIVGLPGDFNQNGTVDAADYVMWRKSSGVDPDPSQADYNLWRANFGNTTLSGAAQAAVPEPNAAALALLAVVGLASRRSQARN